MVMVQENLVNAREDTCDYKNFMIKEYTLYKRAMRPKLPSVAAFKLQENGLFTHFDVDGLDRREINKR